MLPMPLAATAGSTMKMAVKNASATPIVQPIALLEIRSSSGICRLADHVSALKPSAHRLGERHDPADQRDLRPALAPSGRLVGLDLDVALGRAHRDGPGALAAHHHALHDRLAAHVAGLRWSAWRRSRRRSGVLRGLRGVGLRRTGAGSARPGHRCRPASACPCRRGGTPSRARRAARRRVERVVNSLPQEQCTVHST